VRWIALLVAAAMLAACSGIPLSSIPRLMRLQGELLDARPSEFMLAIQVDARMVPPAGAVPTLQLAIQPAQAGTFEPIDKKLPMRFAIASDNPLGLASPPAGRRWLIYSLPPESQAELARIQGIFQRLKAQAEGKGGGSVRIGIAQEGMAARDSALRDTRWETWLQMSRKDGFFELWSGTVGDLLKLAES
jgi:hypothetical protein